LPLLLLEEIFEILCRKREQAMKRPAKRLLSVLWNVACVFSLLALSTAAFGCAFRLRSGSAPEVDSENRSPALPVRTYLGGEAASNGEIPFSLEVLDEVNDGRELYVRARLAAKTVWDPSKVVVRLLGFSAGSVEEESSYRLRDLIEQQRAGSALRAEEQSGSSEYTFALSVPSDGITDYQVEVLWGKDAEALLQQFVKRQLVLKNININKTMDCKGSPCDVSYRITGELLNEGQVTVDKAVLGVAYSQRGAGSSSESGQEAAESEELVEIAGLALSPGMSRAVQVDVDKSVQQQQAATYWPVMRIVSHE